MGKRLLKECTLWLVLLLGVVLLYSFVIQPWHMRWGATDAELAMSLPGDPFIPSTTVVSTRAVKIHAPATQVWAWVVQLGQNHGGFYSYETMPMNSCSPTLRIRQPLWADTHLSSGKFFSYLGNKEL